MSSKSTQGTIAVTDVSVTTTTIGRHITLTNSGLKTAFIRLNDQPGVVTDFPLLAGISMTFDCSQGSQISNVSAICSPGETTTLYYISWSTLTLHNNEEENSFSFEIVMPAPGIFRLPIAYAGSTQNFKVDWGDNSSSVITAWNSPDRSHTYAGAGTYVIKMTGQCSSFAFNNTSSSAPMVTRLLSFTGDMGFSFLNFYGCTGLKRVTSFGNLNSLIDASNMFRSCAALTSIPSNLFSGCSNLSEFVQIFSGCTSITSIPEDLFRYNLNANSFNGCFTNCTQITSVPENLFKYNVKTQYFGNCFSGMTALTSIPSALFRYNVLNQYFNYTFFQCINITSIPEDLFWYTPLVVTFESAFNGCTKLESIPTRLFKYNPLATNFPNTFLNCSGLRGIPAHLFDNNILATGFFGVFQGCSNSAFTSIPADLFKYNVLAFGMGAAFRDCTKLTTVPPDLFRYNTQNLDFSQLFYGCTSLTSIPDDLFRYNPLVTTFNRTLSNTALITLPVDIFRYNTLVTNFGSSIRDCANLITVPSDLFRYNLLCTTFTSAFNGCIKLELHTSIFCAAGEEGTRFLNKSVSFSSCFSRTSYSGSQGTAPDLWNYLYGTGTPTKTTCFGGAGNSLVSLSNYASIPVTWK